MERDDDCCAWCGEPATPERPVRKWLISPPVDGYEPEFIDSHDKCADEAARAGVE